MDSADSAVAETADFVVAFDIESVSFTPEGVAEQERRGKSHDMQTGPSGTYTPPLLRALPNLRAT